MSFWQKYAAIVLGIIVLSPTGGFAYAESISPVVTVPVVAVFHCDSAPQAAVLPAVFVQVERRQDQEPLRLILNHHADMIDANNHERWEAAVRNGLVRLIACPEGLQVNIVFA